MRQNVKATSEILIARDVLSVGAAQDCPHCAGIGNVLRAIRTRPGFDALPCRKCSGTGESRARGFAVLVTVSE